MTRRAPIPRAAVAEAEKLYRIQDASGRGPWRPGFSMKWIDPEKDDSLCPPMQHDFPEWRRLINRAIDQGYLHYGCCVRGASALHRWFTPEELSRLRGFGFRLVDASGLTVICESRSQIIGASRWPLSYLPEVNWEAVI